MTLFFDLDDTLVDSRKAYDQGLQLLGIAPDDPTFLDARKQVKTILGLQPSARSRVLYFKRYLELKSEFKPIHHLELTKKYEECVCQNIKKQWLELKRDALFSTLSSGHRLYIITNETTRMQSLKLQAIDPHFKHFSGLITSEEAGVEKPHSKIFELAFQRAKSEVHNSYMIGDSYEKDIEPALKLGLKTIQTLEFSKEEKTLAPTVTKLDQILEIIFQ